jgi:hypothetical protein
MTQRQIDLLYAAALRREARLRAAHLVDTNQAFTGGKSASQHLQNLHKAGESR